MGPSIKDLELVVAFYEGEVNKVRVALERMQTQLRGAERDLEIATNFLELEKRRFAIANGHVGTDVSRLSKAALAVVREKGRATADEIVKALEERGFAFATNQTGRAIHTALMHAPVRKVAPNTYEIKEGRLI